MVDIESGASIRVRQPQTVQSLVIQEGPQGPHGRSVVSIDRTTGDGSPGTVDTYTITYSDATTSTFTVTNGTNGAGDVSSTRAINTSDGLQGGGDLSADRTLSPAYGTTATTVASGNRGQPVGGTTGQVLTKNSATNYDTGWATPSGGGGGGGALLASVVRTTSTYSTSGTTFSDVDATNFAVTFTAPTSGTVRIRMEAIAAVNSTGYTHFWGLRAEATNVAGSERAMGQNTILQRLGTSITITGLTSGTSYTYKWSYRANGGGAAIYADSSNSRAPAIMEVYSA